MDNYPYTKCGGKYRVPESVKSEARKGLQLRKSGFLGGTDTGWRRARQLIECESVSYQTIKIMKAWFARHGPDAKNGGTSYPGYRKWVSQGKPATPTNQNKSSFRGAVAWLIWGGTPAMDWVKSISI